MKNRLLEKFLEGGEVSPAEGATQAPVEGAPAQGGDEALLLAAQSLVTTLLQQVGDPQAVAAILQAALEMVTSAAQEAAPTFQRLGGKLQKVRK